VLLLNNNCKETKAEVEDGIQGETEEEIFQEEAD